MGPGYIIYKCRLCGGLKKDLHVPEVMTVALHILKGAPLPDHWIGTTMAHDAEFHACPDGNYGLCDFTGYRPDCPK